MQDLGDGNCKIVYDPEINGYDIEWDEKYQSPAEVYMTTKTAGKICDALNKGKLKL
jgi:hypothetical protein